MSWPTPQEYNEAIQNPSSCFADDELKRGRVRLNQLGLPAAATGAFASVYKISGSHGDWAVRCFLNQREEQEARYRKISEFVLADKIDATVPFHYVKEGIRVKGDWYPILKMDWVTGETLDVFLRKHFRDNEKMTWLIEDFQKVAYDLEIAGIAHGDLQHGNMLVTDQGIRLVDYDALYVPALEGLRSLELGHPNYQHPRRTEKNFDTSVDNFSCWLIKTSLEAIAADPDLFERFGCGEEWILLRRVDLCSPEQSPLFNHLLRHPSESIRNNAVVLQRMLWESPERVPELSATSEGLDSLPTEPPEPTELSEVSDADIDHSAVQEVQFLRGGFIDNRPVDKTSKNAPFLKRLGKAIGSTSEQLFRKTDHTTWANYKFNRADKEFKQKNYDVALPLYLELYDGLDSVVSKRASVSCDDGLCKAMLRAAYCYGFLDQKNLAHNCFLVAYNRISERGSPYDKFRVALLLSVSHWVIGQKEAAINVLYRKNGIDQQIQKLVLAELRTPAYLQASWLLELICSFVEEKSFESFESPLSDDNFDGSMFFNTALWLLFEMSTESSAEVQRTIFRLILDSAEFLMTKGTSVESIIDQLYKTCCIIYEKEGREVPGGEWGARDYLEMDSREDRRELNKSVLEWLYFERRHLTGDSEVNYKKLANDLENLSPWVAAKIIVKRLPAIKTISFNELVLNAVPSSHPRIYPLVLMTAAKRGSYDDYKDLVSSVIVSQGLKPRKRNKT